MPSWPSGITETSGYGTSFWTITSANQSSSVVFQWNPPFDSDSFPEVKQEVQKILNLGASSEVLQVTGIRSPVRTIGKGSNPFFITRPMRDGFMSLYRQQFTDGYLWIFPRVPWSSASSDDSARVYMTDFIASREVVAHGELFKCEIELHYLTIPSWS